MYAKKDKDFHHKRIFLKKRFGQNTFSSKKMMAFTQTKKQKPYDVN